MRTACLFTLLCLVAGTARPATPPFAAGDPPYLLEDGWTPLLNGQDLSGWRYEDPAKGGWSRARAVRWDPAANPRALAAQPGPGDRLVNGPLGQATNLVTTVDHGDIELYLEFLLAEKSNSGVYLHGLYEIQILDSHGVTRLRFGDCGGIYTRKVGDQLVGGRPPLVNACRPPGQWQSLHLWFQAPRFDGAGRKTAAARFVHVLLNGVLVQSDQEVDGPTHSAMNHAEAPRNPLMLQGDHGPIAYRNLYLRPWTGSPPAAK